MGYTTVYVLCVVVFGGTVKSLPIENEIDSDFEMPDLSYLGKSVFKTPGPEMSKQLDTWNESSPVNPEELSEYAEGDIVFPKKSRNGLVSEVSRWPNRVIPYEISGYFDSNSLNVIQRAINIYHKYTCIQFRKRIASDDDYITITNANSGCWSSVGRIGGRQEVNLQSPACTTKVGTAVHELMHATGFLHEQNRYERDNYVTIVLANVKKGHEANFVKAEKSQTSGFGVPYDYRSVMHYSSTAFSANGRPTIIPKDPSKEEKMGQRDGFSRGDITKLNLMYNCPEKTDAVTVNKKKPDGSSNTNDNSSTGTGESTGSSNPIGNLANGILGWLFHKK